MKAEDIIANKAVAHFVRGRYCPGKFDKSLPPIGQPCPRGDKLSFGGFGPGCRECWNSAWPKSEARP